MKPKKSSKRDQGKSQVFDRCQTPLYAVEPLYQFLPAGALAWEPAAGDGNIRTALQAHGYGVVCGDLLSDKPFYDYPGLSFFAYTPPAFDVVVTNPPYSDKYAWLRRAYECGKPFAMLVPVETIGSAAGQALIDQHGMEQLLLSPRVDFIMPLKGEGGRGAQFPTFWWCWQLLPKPIMTARLNKPARGRRAASEGGIALAAYAEQRGLWEEDSGRSSSPGTPRSISDLSR